MVDKDRAYFDEGAERWIKESYEDKVSMAKLRLDMINKLVADTSPKSMLDIGCGDGRFLSQFSNCNNRVGIDFSEKMIALAEARNPELQFSNIDLNQKDDLKILALRIPKFFITSSCTFGVAVAVRAMMGIF